MRHDKKGEGGCGQGAEVVKEGSILRVWLAAISKALVFQFY